MKEFSEKIQEVENEIGNIDEENYRYNSKNQKLQEMVFKNFSNSYIFTEIVFRLKLFILTSTNWLKISLRNLLQLILMLKIIKLKIIWLKWKQMLKLT